MSQILDEEERRWAEEESRILQNSGINAQIFNAQAISAAKSDGGALRKDNWDDGRGMIEQEAIED